MIPEGARETYERWRRQWLSGARSNAMAALRFHGLRVALALVARGRPRPRPPSRPTQAADLVFPEGVIAEAANQVRQLLRTSSVPIIDPLGARRNHHV